MGKTVTTYLIDGVPTGTQYVMISNKICKMYIIPRSNLSILNDRDELQKPAFYILIGEDEATKPKAYIGETENFRDRVRDHDSKKSFWQKALLFISTDSAITKADVQYLEYKSISLAKEANSYVLNENKQTPKAPNLSEWRKDDMDDFFEDVKFLTSFSGCSIFELPKRQDKHLFYTKSHGCEAVGFYGSDGFTVLDGSVLYKNNAPSMKWKEKRNSLIREYASIKGDKLILESPITFPSPSTAAVFCLGRSSNGWTAWKDKEGKTLDDLYRQK